MVLWLVLWLVPYDTAPVAALPLEPTLQCINQLHWQRTKFRTVITPDVDQAGKPN